MQASPADGWISPDSLPESRTRPVQWGRLWRHLQILNGTDPQTVLDAAYSVGDSLGGMSEERQLKRFLSSPSGQALLESKASLTEALADRAALGRMPEDSLGRAFLEFAERHGLNPRKLIESQHEMSRDYARLDPVRQFVRDRSTVMHDLWHVLVGYDATEAGESALMCFSLPQRVNDRALPIFIAMSVLTGKLRISNAWEALQRGRRAASLIEQPFEQLLPLPLAQVRGRLLISEPRTAHPGAVSEGLLI